MDSPSKVMAEVKRVETIMALIQGPGMEVIVSDGIRTQNWVLPKALLSHHSEFFRAACNGPYKEGIENKITLHDCHPEVFETFLHWLYFGTIPYQEPKEDGIDSGFRLWVLGDRLLTADFKNAAMWDFYDTFSGEGLLVCPREIVYIWQNTTENSALRRWVLDFVSLNWQYHCGSHTQSTWMEVFSKIPEFESGLLFRLGTRYAELRIGNYLEDGGKTTRDELDGGKL